VRYADGRIGLFIADVSGKGMPAALLMSSLQARIQVLFQEPNSLAEQVSRLNQITAANCPGNCFITLFTAILDPAAGRIEYCNAGHNPPLLIHKNDAVEQLGPSGLPIGIMTDATYEEGTCALERGDVLVLFSDGLTEALNPDSGEEFGEERLIAVLKRGRDQLAAKLIESIKAEVSLFTAGAVAADDITIVVARRL
jgi:sigma-B regulation protein RsbU (phosphoserine phosphatase)